jgi:hypothetical protein
MLKLILFFPAVYGIGWTLTMLWTKDNATALRWPAILYNKIRNHFQES